MSSSSQNIQILTAYRHCLKSVLKEAKIFELQDFDRSVTIKGRTINIGMQIKEE